MNFYSKTNYGALVNGKNINRPNCVVLKVNATFLTFLEGTEYLVDVKFACNGKVAYGTLVFDNAYDTDSVLVGYNFHLDSVTNFKVA